MHPVRGFERPVVQWAFVALAAVLVAVAGGEAIGLRRAQASIQQLRAAGLNAQADRQQLERRLLHEQSARESFALAAARAGGTHPAGTPEPTLTLAPVTSRGATPPDATVEAPAVQQSIQLRLLLPKGRADATKRYAVALRTWSGGGVVWSRNDLRAGAIDGRAGVAARVTGEMLAPGAYELALTEITADGASPEVAFYEVTVGPRPL
jgi:hypothetical protein